MIIKLIVDAGDMKPGPAIAQKIGPLGINMGKIIQEINKETAGFKGIKVPVNIDIDIKTKNFSINVSTPSVSELLKKEIGIEKGSGAHGKMQVGNMAIEQIVNVAKIKHQGMLANTFKTAVTNVLGSCLSLGILVENKSPKEIIKEIKEGKYKEEIEKQITTMPAEKKKQLESYFTQIKSKQDELMKKEAEEEAAKAAEKAATAQPATGAAATTAPAKTAEKKAAPAVKK
jgi:large subunit ribosomal protein L11